MSVGEEIVCLLSRNTAFVLIFFFFALKKSNSEVSRRFAAGHLSKKEREWWRVALRPPQRGGLRYFQLGIDFPFNVECGA